MKREAMPIVAVCLVLLLAVVPVLAQQPAANASEKQWKPEDVIYTETAGQMQLSPDGRWLVWVKSVTDKEKDGRTSNLFLSSTSEKNEVQLTRGGEQYSRPRWSPDGKLIVFISSRPYPNAKPEASKSQLWFINPFGGEPWHVTEFERGINSHEWVDSDTIIFSAEEDPSLYERETKRKKDDTRVVDDVVHRPPVRLYRYAVKDRKVTRLTANEDWIQSWAVSRDGKKAVTVHGRNPSYAWNQEDPPRTFLYDLETGAAKELFAGQRIHPSTLRWARDNSGFYAVAPFSSHPVFQTASINLVYFYDLAGDRVQKVDLGWENGVSGFDAADGGFLTLLCAGVRFEPALYQKSAGGWTRQLLEGEHVTNLFDFTVAENGKAIAYSHSTASKPAQLYAAALDGVRIGTPLQITALNPAFSKKTIARTEVLRWKGANDEEVEGLLYYPHVYESGRRHPLVLSIHGGPAGADLDAWSQSWSTPVNLLNQRGAFVLKVNYHGSSNYGLKWVESICCGNYYTLEIPDIERGVDHLIGRGLVDAGRVATMGWSNGSILSIQLSVTNPERYKVVSAGAGDVEWISDWANVDFGHAFDTYYFGKSPLEDPQLYLSKSPLFKLDQVKAPTIIFFGTEDRQVPTSQGWTHYRALSHIGKVPVRFLLFPGEAHGPQKLSHQLRKVEEEMKWFDRYFFKTETEANEAFKEDAPLGIALKRKAVAKVGANYGVTWKAPSQPAAKASRGAKPAETAVLIPEVVKRGELEIARFEITRAQYAAFDPAFQIEPGTENYPANGVTLEKARQYAEWLSKTTGQTYRLPDESEVAALYKSSAGENTLDYWAGYAVNPDDAARLAAKIKELGGPAALLKPVGSFRADGAEGEELLFDLGGNVAEWVLTKEGAGKTLGGSADRPADTKARSANAELLYTGFRVVRGAAKK